MTDNMVLSEMALECEAQIRALSESGLGRQGVVYAALEKAYRKGCADTRAMWAPDSRHIDSDHE